MSDIERGKELVGKILSHEYDPVAAREYYLRTRKLKGRHASQVEQLVKREAVGKAVVRKAPHRKAVPPQRVPSRRSSQHKADLAAHRVDQLNARLERLRKLLAELTKAAKERSGVDTTPSTDSSDPQKTADANASAKKRLTPKQKREAAVKAKQAYDKKHKEDQNAAEVEAKIADVKEKIYEARQNLQDVIAKQQRNARLSGTSKTASNGR